MKFGIVPALIAIAILLVVTFFPGDGPGDADTRGRSGVAAEEVDDRRAPGPDRQRARREGGRTSASGVTVIRDPQLEAISRVKVVAADGSALPDQALELTFDVLSSERDSFTANVRPGAFCDLEGLRYPATIGVSVAGSAVALLTDVIELRSAMDIEVKAVAQRGLIVEVVSPHGQLLAGAAVQLQLTPGRESGGVAFERTVISGSDGRCLFGNAPPPSMLYAQITCSGYHPYRGNLYGAVTAQGAGTSEPGVTDHVTVVALEKRRAGGGQSLTVSSRNSEGAILEGFWQLSASVSQDVISFGSPDVLFFGRAPVGKEIELPDVGGSIDFLEISHDGQRFRWPAPDLNSAFFSAEEPRDVVLPACRAVEVELVGATESIVDPVVFYSTEGSADENRPKLTTGPSLHALEAGELTVTLQVPFPSELALRVHGAAGGGVSASETVSKGTERIQVEIGEGAPPRTVKFISVGDPVVAAHYFLEDVGNQGLPLVAMERGAVQVQVPQDVRVISVAVESGIEYVIRIVKPDSFNLTVDLKRPAVGAVTITFVDEAGSPLSGNQVVLSGTAGSAIGVAPLRLTADGSAEIHVAPRHTASTNVNGEATFIAPLGLYSVTVEDRGVIPSITGRFEFIDPSQSQVYIQGGGTPKVVQTVLRSSRIVDLSVSRPEVEASGGRFTIASALRPSEALEFAGSRARFRLSSNRHEVVIRDIATGKSADLLVPASTADASMSATIR